MANDVIILGHEIPVHKKVNIQLDLAKQYTRMPINLQVIIERASKPGPTIMLLGGVHGDEINGVEIVRRMLIDGHSKPDAGMVISVPVFNIFGFLNRSREFPDGRDSNRSFPGSPKGSLAGRFAHQFMTKLAPLADYAIDFHTGGRQRANMAQVRCMFDNEDEMAMARAFNPPFLFNSPYLPKTLRKSFSELGKKIILFEGGRSDHFDNEIVDHGVSGALRVMKYLGIKKQAPVATFETIKLEKSSWMRASQSGMFQPFASNGSKVFKGQLIGSINDPYGLFQAKVKAARDGYIFCVNQDPLVHQGDALFHIGYN